MLALHAAVRRPKLFGRAICQSVAAFEDPELSTISLIRSGPVSPARLWLDAGDHEWLAGPNDRLAAMLAERGYDSSLTPAEVVVPARATESSCSDGRRSQTRPDLTTPRWARLPLPRILRVGHRDRSR